MFTISQKKWLESIGIDGIPRSAFLAHVSKGPFTIPHEKFQIFIAKPTVENRHNFFEIHSSVKPKEAITYKLHIDHDKERIIYSS
jgi:hypothetical protein